MFYDYHTHCNSSHDSTAAPEDMIKAAAAKGVKHICFTDHFDIDFPFGVPTATLDIGEYSARQKRIAKASSKLIVRRGIEVGMQPQAMDYISSLLEGYNFDFIIASLHVVKGQDAYFPEYFEGRAFRDCYREYLGELFDCLVQFDNYSIVGHIGYPSRWVPYDNAFMRYKDMPDEADAVLKRIAESGHGIEVNTSGYAQLSEPVPGFDFVRRFKELGGEIVTIGSDAHAPAKVAQHFDAALAGVKEAGFDYIATFKDMKPEFVSIDDCLLSKKTG